MQVHAQLGRLYPAVENPATQSPTQSSSTETPGESFTQQLSDAFSQALKSIGIDPGFVQISGQNPDSTGDPRQFVVTLAPGAGEQANAAAGAAVTGTMTPFGMSVPASGQSNSGTATAAATATNGTQSGTVDNSSSTSTATDSSDPTTSGDSPEMTTLKNALEQAGIDPGPLNLTQVDDFEGRPFGGSYWNHLFVAQTPSGQHCFDVGLTMQDPQVTVVELQHLLNPTASWA